MGILQARILEWVALLQGIFPTKGLNTGLPHCRQILYHLNHQGSPEVQGELGKSSGTGGWIWEEIHCRWTEIPWRSWHSRSKPAPQNPSNWGGHPSAKQGGKARSLRNCDHIPALRIIQKCSTEGKRGKWREVKKAKGKEKGAPEEKGVTASSEGSVTEKSCHAWLHGDQPFPSKVNKKK